ncbi:MAG: DNA replication and repair protein RecF [Deltaproteobacteria bacterium]|nr:DNA replication and repair protein RecF [Deltaproteobacteria bacterium]
MVIHSLKLNDFRNYENIDVEFNSGINFIYGKNGQGKTNLIESLYLVTHLKSFRTSKVSDLTLYSKKISSVQTDLSKQNVRHDIRITLHENLKKVLHNQKIVNYTSEYIKNFLSLLFSPDQLVAYKEFPLERRNFIDRILFLIDKKYFQRIKEFNRIKKQKNVLLRNGKKGDIFVWNQLMAVVIPEIIESRELIVEKINEVLEKIFKALTGRDACLKFFYGNDLNSKTDLSPDSILKYLAEKMDQEIGNGYCLFGPHKDNFWMTLDGKKDRQAFSQGEYRIAYLSLQLAMNKIISGMLGFKPILLLDDIFSELDETVCENTIAYITQSDNQVFMTSTAIPEKFMDIGDSFCISNGGLSTA